MISTVVKGADFSPDEVHGDPRRGLAGDRVQPRSWSRSRRALEVASDELRRVNQRLTELDRLKDEFLSTVSHELRTPLDLDPLVLRDPARQRRHRRRPQRNQFLDVVVKESERLTRLINDILDMSRIESGRMDWQLCDLRPDGVVDDALAATSGLFRGQADQRSTPALAQRPADRSPSIATG